MLSNTDDTNPRPRVVGHDAGGNCSTGISDAHITSDKRKMLPFTDSGTTVQSGFRHGTASRIAAHTAAPMNGKLSDTDAKRVLMSTLAPIAATKIRATMATRLQSMRVPCAESFWIGEWRCCWIAAGTAKMTSAAAAAT